MEYMGQILTYRKLHSYKFQVSKKGTTKVVPDMYVTRFELATF